MAKRTSDRLNVRLDPRSRWRLAQLLKKYEVENASHVVRQALRCLAEQEGIGEPPMEERAAR